MLLAVAACLLTLWLTPYGTLIGAIALAGALAWQGRPGGDSSSVDELVLPLQEDGSYTLEKGKAFGPDGPAWSYSAPKKSDFLSSFISGAHRLPNGNTQICSGGNGTVFEVTPDKDEDPCEVCLSHYKEVGGGRSLPSRLYVRRADRKYADFTLTKLDVK